VSYTNPPYSPPKLTPEQRKAFLELQAKRCSDTGAPFFMPTDGICWHCGRDVVAVELEWGNDGSELVTGCRWCSYSYCE
jgi:uncharacterized OB-fold protein